jgi:hypothetical protein
MIGSPASSDRAYPASAASFRAKRNLCFNHMDQIISCPDSSLDIDQDGVGMTKAHGRAFAEKGARPMRHCPGHVFSKKSGSRFSEKTCDKNVEHLRIQLNREVLQAPAGIQLSASVRATMS